METTSKKMTWLAALCALAAITLHSQALDSPPLFDDKLLLTVQQIFTEYSVPFTAWQRWLSYGTFAWTYMAVGENWPVFRAENILLHAATVVALLAFYRKLFGQTGLEGAKAVQMAATGALLFAVHPVSVYAVDYLIQRSIVMATLFSVLALLAILKARENREKHWLIAAAVLYFLALSSKEHALMLPLVAGSMVYLVERNQTSQAKHRAIVYGMALFLAALVVAAVIYRELIATPFDASSRELVKKLAATHPAIGEHVYLLSVINEAYLYFKYLILWLIPMSGWLSIDMRPPFPTQLYSWPQVLGPVMFLAYGVIAAFLLRKGGEKGLLGFGMLVPWLLYPTEFATVWIQDPFVMYRSYIWLIGLPAVIPIVYARLGSQPSLALFIFMALAFTWSSQMKVETFKGEFALWDDAVRYNERTNHPMALGQERAYNERALAHAQAGRYGEATADYSKAIALNGKDANLYANRAALNLLQNNVGRAQQDLNTAYMLAPDNPRVRYNRAAAYLQAGNAEAARKELDEAMANPLSQSADGFTMRGLMRLKQGDFGGANVDLTHAIQMGGGTAEVYSNRGAAKASLGDLANAEADFTEAIKVDARWISGYINRAIIRAQVGRYQEALADAEAAISIDPTQIKPHMIRAQIYAATGRPQDAITEYGRILDANPNEVTARLSRAEVYAAIGSVQAARQDFEASCKLGVKQACSRAASLAQ